jgi:porin
LATGVPVPIFPLTGLGISARWDIADEWSVQAAVFDGDQTGFERNPHNVKWSLSRADGILAMSEVHFKTRGNSLFKLGAYYHSADRNYGFYALADQPLGERVGVFAQLALAPRAKNENNYSVGAGANFELGERHTAGIALTHAGLHSAAHGHETAIEVYYKYTLSDNIALQPDVQYIIHPSGAGRLPNALAGILRLHLEF